MVDRDNESVVTTEQHIAGAAKFMAQNGITAVLIDGRGDDGQRYEGISFAQGNQEIGELRFVDGNPVPTTSEELERRLAVSGFINGVVRPVIYAAGGVYRENSDLLDERFDQLPGFSE